MMRKRSPSFTIDVPRPFDFRLMILSHGWCDLVPFVWRTEERLLDTVFRVGRRPLSFRIGARRDPRGGMRLRAVQTGGKPIGEAERKEAKERIRMMFRLDEDFTPFHGLCAKRKELGWVKGHGLGSFLRNPSLFEEFVKVLLTTNVSWAGTRSMTRLLMERLGETVRPWEGEGEVPRAFPPAESIAGLTEKALREEVRVGYRAPFLLAFAEKVAAGALDLDRFLDRSRSTGEIAAEIGSIKGFGPYAVSALLLSLGRYDRLILDSWIRATVAKVHFRSPRVSDRSIERKYAPWGEWKVLACWFDCAWESWLRDDALAGGTAS